MTSSKVCSLGAIGVAFLLGLGGATARAASLTWDASGSNPLADGGGGWNVGANEVRWYNGSTYQAWNNSASPLDTAVFGLNTLGTQSSSMNVTINSSVPNLGGLTINPAGNSFYNFQRNSTAGFTGGAFNFAAGSVITMNNGSRANLRVPLQGSAPTIAGTGTLTLLQPTGTASGTSTITGTMTINSGAMLSVGYAPLLGTVNRFVNNGRLELNASANPGVVLDTITGSGTLAINGFSPAFVGTNPYYTDINVGTGQGVQIVGNGLTTTINTGITFQNGGSLSGLIKLNGNAATKLVLGGSNSNDFEYMVVRTSELVLNKDATVDAVRNLSVTNNGKVTWQNDEQVNDQGQISMVNGGTLDLNGRNETVGLLYFYGAAANPGMNIIQGGTINCYDNPINLDSGILAVNGGMVGNNMQVKAGAVLQGSGKVDFISGDGSTGGLISPGNSPGILTAAGVLTTSGALSFAFEMTGVGSPAWGSPTASTNDVLRLTDPTPFPISGLDSGNTVSVYFNVGSLSGGEVFRGGFFTDTNSNFTSDVDSATYVYYAYDPSGTTSFQGVNYSPLATMYPSLAGVTRSVVQVASANFADGTVSNGWVQQFAIVPEPGSVALVASGVGGLLAFGRFRRRRR